VRRVINQEEIWERLPLTREDVKHPQLGDTIVHKEYHERFSTYLYDVLALQLADDPQAVVLHDVGVYWEDKELGHHAPDIAVIFNVQTRKEWSYFKVVEEGSKPSLIIEVTSLNNRSMDLVDKLDEYEQAGVPYYVVVDTYRYQKKLTRRLLGYRLAENGHYEILSPDEQQRLWLEAVGLWIAFRDNALVCYDQSGQAIANYTGVVAQRDEARREAQKAKAEVARLLAELARLRGE
jgi:Uma2 family endonuclease